MCIVKTMTVSDKVVYTKLQTKDGIIFKYRENTSDIKAIREACANIEGETKRSSSYERIRKEPVFRLTENDHWLDCGGQIGSFTLRALQNGAKSVVAVEPEEDNATLLQENIDLNPEILKGKKFTLCKLAIVPVKTEKFVTLYKTNSTYRHTLINVKKNVGTQKVKCETLTWLLEKYKKINAVKLDVEGNEKAILESVDWKNTKVNKLVFEYSFDHHPVMDEFYDLVDYLRQHFTTVFYRPSIPSRGEVWNTKITRGVNGILIWSVNT